MVLDRNPENHFAEVDQAGFAPARLVPGIGLSPDKMLMGRFFSYHVLPDTDQRVCLSNNLCHDRGQEVDLGDRQQGEGARLP